MNISKYIDHTLLKSTVTERDIIEHCEEAKKYHFFSISINSCYIPLAKQLLYRSDVKICAAVGFPLGTMKTEAKVFEAKNAIEDGAQEIDIVINQGLLKSRNYVAVLKDISDVKIAVGRIPLKVVIEISELSKNEIIKASEICLDAKVDYIKTSTGFSKSGATLTAVKIIKKTVKERLKIEATGDIKDLETIQKYINIGANRISTSSGIDIVTKKVLRRV